MPGYLDIENWNRRRQFEFFKSFDNPFFNICTHLDVTPLLGLTREKKLSFFIAYHFLSMKAANEVEPFRYRLRACDRVLVHDRIHAGTTLLLMDETFTFVYFDYDKDFEVFHARAKATVERARAGVSRLDERADMDDVIHHSVIPWVTFTSISHARNWGHLDSVPKIAFGKYRAEGERIKMPISVEAHHALMDGLHVGRYFERLAGYFSNPHSALDL